MSRFFSGICGRIGAFLGPAFGHIPLSNPVLDERETFVRRTLVGAVVVGAAGGTVLLLFGHPGWAVAFSLGAAVSLGNFHLITRAVRGLTESDARPASRHLWKAALFRFIIVGIVLFLAVVVLQVNVLALLAGLVLTQLGMIGYWLVRSARTMS